MSKRDVVEVMNISLLGHVRIRSPVGVKFPTNKTIFNEDTNIRLGKEGPLTFSNTRNKFIAIGCNFFGILEGIREEDRYMKTACLSYCRDKSLGCEISKFIHSIKQPKSV